MKQLILLFLGLLTTILSSTAQTSKALVLLKNDKSEVSILLAKNPVISFPGVSTIEIKTGNIFFTHGGDIETIQIESKDVQKMTIEDLKTSSINTPNSQNDTVLSLEPNSLRIKVFSENDFLEIYALDGRLILSEILEHGETLIPLDRLPKEVIIIKVDNQTLKLLRQ